MIIKRCNKNNKKISDFWTPPIAQPGALTNSFKSKLYPVFEGNTETTIRRDRTRRLLVMFISGNRLYRADNRIITEPYFLSNNGMLEYEFFMFCHIYGTITPNIELVVEDISSGTLFGYKGTISILNKYALRIDENYASELNYSSVTSELTPISIIGTNLLKCSINSFVEIGINLNGTWNFTQNPYTPSISDITSFETLHLKNI